MFYVKYLHNNKFTLIIIYNLIYSESCWNSRVIYSDRILWQMRAMWLGANPYTDFLSMIFNGSDIMLKKIGSVKYKI